MERRAHRNDDVEALVLAATSSLSLRDAGKLEDRRETAGARAGKENTSIGNNGNENASRWRGKALAALSQLSALQQRASAAELRACELQLAVDQAALTSQTQDAEHRSVRAALAALQEERDRLTLEVKLRSVKSTGKPDGADIAPPLGTAQGTEKNAVAPMQPVTRQDDHRHRTVVDHLEAQLDALRAVHEETKLENESLALGQQGLKERVTALQELVAKLQDENDYFSSFRAEDLLAQEEEVDAVYGTTARGEREPSSDLRQQLQDRETELLEVFETLDQERERSKNLHEQCIKQAEEIVALKDRMQAMDSVHTRDREELVNLRLALDAAKRDTV